MIYFRLPAIILGISLILCLISYADNDEFTKFWSVASNIAYLAPTIIAYQNVETTGLFVYFFILMMILSSAYHLCYSYDNACFLINHDNWVHTDVLFSWLLLYTLISYVVFKNKYTDITLLTNVVIVVVTLEANCQKANFDCQSSKILLAFVYFVIFLYRIATERYDKLIHARDATLSFLFLGIASIFYFNGSYKPSHSLWHVTGAIGACFVLSIYKDSKIHTIGLEIKKTSKQDELESKPLLKRNELYQIK